MLLHASTGKFGRIKLEASQEGVKEFKKLIINYQSTMKDLDYYLSEEEFLKKGVKK